MIFRTESHSARKPYPPPRPTMPQRPVIILVQVTINGRPTLPQAKPEDNRWLSIAKKTIFVEALKKIIGLFFKWLARVVVMTIPSSAPTTPLPVAPPPPPAWRTVEKIPADFPRNVEMRVVEHAMIPRRRRA